ncbi:MAG TPA: hypothetical protein DCQ14_01385 [Firmicutes bacterium]|nr:hypothetical protein [Bacillota bacterium]
MHIVRMLNEMALHSVSLAEHVKDVGIQSFIKKLYIALVYRKLDTRKASPVDGVSQSIAAGAGRKPKNKLVSGITNIYAG